MPRLTTAITITDMGTHSLTQENTDTNKHTHMASVCGGRATSLYTEYAEHILYRYVDLPTKTLEQKTPTGGKEKKLPFTGRVASAR